MNRQHHGFIIPTCWGVRHGFRSHVMRQGSRWFYYTPLTNPEATTCRTTVQGCSSSLVVVASSRFNVQSHLQSDDDVQSDDLQRPRAGRPTRAHLEMGQGPCRTPFSRPLKDCTCLSSNLLLLAKPLLAKLRDLGVG